MRDVSPNSSVIVVEGEFSGFTPDELFQHWVVPELLVKWWPREATVDLRDGGAYVFTWPQQNWRLQGQYTEVAPGKRLGFTWAWNHGRTSQKPLEVLIDFEPREAGSFMRITHKSFSHESDEQTDRQAVLEGWIHFGMRLAGLRRGFAT